MASFRNKLEQHLEHQIYAIYDEESPITVPETDFGRVMVLDSRKISDSVITLYNDDTGDSFDYKIFGSNKYVELDNGPEHPTPNPETVAPPINDESWINILIDGSLVVDILNPFNTNQEFFKTIPARTSIVGWNYESFSNKWAWIQILARTSKSGGLSASIFHRGTN